MANGLIDFGTLRPNAAMESYQQGQQNQLAQMQLGQQQQAIRDAELEREAYKTAGNDYAKLEQEFFNRGLGKQGMAVNAARAKQQSDRVAMLKGTTELLESTAKSIFNNPATAEQRLLQFGKQTGHNIEQDLAELRSYGGDEAKIKSWAAGHAFKAADLLPKFQQFDTPGGGKQIGAVDPLTAKFTATTTMAPQMTPGEKATDARERERIKNSQDPTVVDKQVVNDNGTVTNFNKFGQVIGTVAGAGKQSATYAKTEAQKKTLAADQKLVIGELTEAIKEGGLIDQSTGSGAGRLFDAGAGFFGKATEGDIAIGRLQPIADIVLKTVPRFEGPQSDKDTASYKEAAGNLANANLPREKRKAAAQEIIRLMQKRQGQFITSDMASGNTAAPSGVAPPAGFVPD